MSEHRRHPDIFTAEEAAAYLGLDSVRGLDPLRQRWGLKPLPISRGIYHRADLDAVVERAMGQRDRRSKSVPAGRDTKLKIGG